MTVKTFDINNPKDLVKKFLKDVENKLPFWLKSKKEEMNEILLELENHIWDRASELSEGNEPSLDHLKQAIEQMGSPSEIANEYKHRGKPKYFITEELWPMYTKVLVIICGIVVGFNFLGMIIGFFSKPPGQNIADTLSGIFTSIAVVFILVTIQFIFLAREGYLPEDFKKLMYNVPGTIQQKIDEKKAEKETHKTQLNKIPSKKIPLEEKPVKIIAEHPIEQKVYKETVIIKEPYPVRVREPGVQKKEYYQGGNYLFEGIFGIVFGIACIVLPFMPVMDFLHDELKVWIAIFGGIAVLTGIIRFIQALVGRHRRLQQFFMLVSIIPKGLNIPLFLALLERPEILLNRLMNIATFYSIDIDIALSLKITVWIIIGITIVSMIIEFSRAIRLEIEGSP